MRDHIHRTIAEAVAGFGLGAWPKWREAAEADLRGQVAVITGGSRGLGYLLAREFAREGCRVVICARDGSELEEARRDLEGQGATVLTHVCDITDRNAVEGLIAAAIGRFGHVDILVNNAGIIKVGPLEAMTLADFEEAMDVMFWGMLYPTLAVLPHMRARHSGRIVNITSIGGMISVPHLLPYSCAKFAAVGLSEGLRAELAREGIVVTTIAPGLMRTGSHLNAQFKGQRSREYAIFSLAASLPLISMDAERAASQIVTATKRGEAERILSAPATIGARAHGLFPGLTSDLLGLANRLLPAYQAGGDAPESGKDVEQRVGNRWLDALTTLGRAAARHFHE